VWGKEIVSILLVVNIILRPDGYEGYEIVQRSFLWQLYITFHTFLFGIPFLFFPNLVLPWVGFPPTDEPWIHVAGILFLVIGMSSYSVYKNRSREMILPGVKVRSAVVLVLLYLAYQVESLFILIMAAIILIGIMGSIVSYKQEFVLPKPEIFGK
jgi:hypothetical protein